ncbi:MAG TPA: XrtA system polysaccharide deacetylase [Fimbriiglobus sp.]|nr:XrtA system polysaccharide deacetylase [Fimbriiglobus sp.]
MASVVLSFDVEEHDRIEAAAGLKCPAPLRREYADRMERATRRLLDILDEAGAKATFFVLGEIARRRPRLVRDIADAGHEVASHGWDHRRVQCFSPTEFLDDVRASKDALEQAAGGPVVGYRAPTFSIGRRTGWAIDGLAEAGYQYDSSVFPVRHDRYGVPDAPRTPFVAEGESAHLIELPPATCRALGQNLPVAGGGYFRLFPLALMESGLRQLTRTDPAVGVLYFHPWEFDPEQPRLPLGWLARWRTYVGVGRSSARLSALLARHAGRFRRAVDVVADLRPRMDALPRFRLAPAGVPALTVECGPVALSKCS